MLIHSISYCDPIAAFENFARDPYAVFLDGAAASAAEKRFSYIATRPLHIVEATLKKTTIDGQSFSGDPFAALRQELKKFQPNTTETPVPFSGGAIGYLVYEFGGRIEKLPQPRHDAFDPPCMMMGVYDVIAAFDHARKKAWIIGQNGTEARIDELAHKLSQTPGEPSPIDWSLRGSWQADLTREEVIERIEKIIGYIYAGDIFQANFTQRFRAGKPKTLDDFMLYRRLRALTPAPFAAFMRGENFSIASASPERFLRVTPERIVEAQPIKGTRPRSNDPARDAALASELQNSAKDRAENLMIVDLMRSDLSRVCMPGSVQVPDLCKLESFATVHHLVSTVTGRLQTGMDAIDLLRASFPGGSITGAPKIRAMEIIHELEPAPRGVYCGCLGWIGFDGAMDMSMVIRTLTIGRDSIHAQAGGGIVADSNPADEYEESMLKISPLLQALTGERS